MVAGDLVNTASRIQAAAEPGTVLVGEATRRATRGGDRLRGRRRARAQGEGRAGAALARRPGGRGGAAGVGRSAGPRAAVRRPRPRAAPRQGALPRVRGRGPRAPRLGRRHRRHRQVAPRVGVREVHRRAGRGRLVAPRPLPRLRRRRRVLGARRDGADARADPRGRGRRGRARSSARPSTEHVPDPDERRWVEPRLAAPARSRGPGAPDQENLFSAWRLFFERLAAGSGLSSSRTSTGPTAALLDFVEYLLEWSRSHPIFVLTLARPELPTGDRPGAPASATFTLALPRAAPAARRWTARSRASCPACPTSCGDASASAPRAVPLYAVETVRMLLDRGLLAREGDVLPRRPAPIDDARRAGDAPRADRRPSRRPRARRSAGSSRTRSCSARRSRRGPRADRLAGPRARAAPRRLVRKEMLSLEDRPALARARPVRLPPGISSSASPTRRSRGGSARRSTSPRRATSRAPAPTRTRSSRSSRPTTSTPTAPRRTTRTRPRCSARGSRPAHPRGRAGRVARGDARRPSAHFERAAELADEPLDAAELLERAGEMAPTAAARRCGVALRAVDRPLRGGGCTHPAARVSARIGDARPEHGRLDEAIERMERRSPCSPATSRTRTFAVLAAQLGRLLFFAGRGRRSRSSGSSSRSRWRRPCDLPEVYRRRSTRSPHPYARAAREGLALLRRPSRSRSSTISRRPRCARLLQPRGRAARAAHEARSALVSGLALARRRGEPYWEASMPRADRSVPRRRLGCGARMAELPEQRGRTHGIRSP